MATPLSRKTAFAAVAVLYLAMLAIGSIPGEAAGLGRLLPDYVLHFAAYGTYAALIAYGLGPATRTRAMTVVIAIAVMGTLDEAIQAMLSYRTSDIHDWKVDMLAALAVTLVYALVSGRRGPRGRSAG